MKSYFKNYFGMYDNHTKFGNFAFSTTSESNHMNTSILSFKQRDVEIIVPFISTMGILMFLFFIDEGYYDFRWMVDIGNWVVFFIYFIILFPLQVGISELVLRKASGRKKMVLMVLVVMPLMIVSLMSLFYLIGA
jgi:hypothetical protein